MKDIDPKGTGVDATGPSPSSISDDYSSNMIDMCERPDVPREKKILLMF